MINFWDSNVWGFITVMAVLSGSLLLANLLKKSILFLKRSLIPTSVLGGLILLIISLIFEQISGKEFFNTEFFGYNGQNILEMLTYHCLALGFIASTFSSIDTNFNKKRNREIFDTGVTTVSTYIIQGIFGLGFTILISLVVKDFFPAAGVLLPFGYGQGTGQAMNYGTIYETDFGFAGGKMFGLSVAALGFLSASIGGVIHLNILRKKGLYKFTDTEIVEALNNEDIQSNDEIPMNGSIDKMSIQVAITFLAYVVSYIVIYVLAKLVPGFQSILYGFNFLFGVIFASLIKSILKFLRKKKIVEKQYINPFLMKRICGFCFDIMIVAGIAAIRLELLKGTWIELLVLGLIGAFITYFYLRIVCRSNFQNYEEEEFLAMYGMLTGTASTGMILLRQVDPEFKGPVAENLVYQNFPAIVFGFPMMLLATLAPKKPVLTFLILIGFFLVLQIILFRRRIFISKRRLERKAKKKLDN